MVIMTGLVLVDPSRPAPTPQAVHVTVYLGRYPAGRVNNVLPVDAPAIQPRTNTVPVTERAKEAGLVAPPTLVIPLESVASIHLGSLKGVVL